MDAFRRLLIYCRLEGFKGYDPHDGLNSHLLAWLGLSRFSSARLVLSTFCRRSPLNLRVLLGIQKEYNPKGIALFLSGLSRYAHRFTDSDVTEAIDWLKGLLKSLQTPGYSGMCWGYNFDWQSRIFFCRSIRRP